MKRYSPADRARIIGLLATSALERENRSPNYARTSRETGIDRARLREWWNNLGDDGRRKALAAAEGSAPATPSAGPTSPEETPGLRARLAQRMGRKPDDPAVDIAVDLHMERDRTVSDGPRAAATKELARFLAQHLTAGGRAGPETPDEFIARCRECEELVIEAVLGAPGILTDPRIVEAVREANHEAAEGR